MVRLGVAQNAFLAQDGDMRISRAERSFDELLAAHVQFQLDVVLRRRIDFLRRPEMEAHEGAGGAGGPDSAILCSFHGLEFDTSGPPTKRRVFIEGDYWRGADVRWMIQLKSASVAGTVWRPRSTIRTGNWVMLLRQW